MHTHQFSKIVHTLVIAALILSNLILPASVAVAAPAQSSLYAAFTNCASQTEIPEAECNALVALYNSTDGEHWTTHTDWLQTDTPCSWYGISCGLGHVAAIQLWSNNLSGTIPSQISDLSGLYNLWFDGNALTGSIPSGIGLLTNLTVLSMPNNQLSGPVPSSLGNLENLIILNLANNDLTGNIPQEFGYLAALQELWLFDNQLSGSIPEGITGLTGLTKLGLYNNQLTGNLPSDIGNLVNLQHLTTYQNQLSGEIPSSITNLVNLIEFGLSCGETSSDPAVIAFVYQKWPEWANDNCQPKLIVVMPALPSRVTLQNWPPGATFTITVDDPTTPENPDYTRTTDSLDSYLTDFGAGLQPGFTVSATDGTTTKSVVIGSQSITAVDVLNSRVHGVTPFSTPVTVKARCNGIFYTRYIMPTPNVEWTADFSLAGIRTDEQTTVTLTYGCKINAWQNYPDGNQSGYKWLYFEIDMDPMNDEIGTISWAPGTYLTLTIDDPADGTGDVDYTTGPVVMGEIPSTGLSTHLLFDLGDYDLKSGDIVTIHAGPDEEHTDIYQTTSTIDWVNITYVDLYNDIVYGIAPPNQLVIVYTDMGGERDVMSDDNGNWQADFSQPGLGGSYEEQLRVDLTSDSTLYVLLQVSMLESYTQLRWPSAKSRLVDSTGRIVFSENAEIQVPAGSVSSTLELDIVENGSGFQITTSDETILDAAASATINAPEGTVFDPPATVTLEWPDANDDGVVDETTINEADLYVSKNGTIIAGPCSTDPGCNAVANTFSVQVTSLSYFVLGSQAINHEPSVSAATLVIGDNTPNGTSVDTVSYTDEDAGQTHTCSIYDGNVDNAFAINASTCKITVNDASKIDYTVKPSYSLKVRVTDDGAPARHGDAVITVNVIRCYALTLGHTGSGSNPTANPTHSTGCANGSYSEGESILFSGAVPVAGWQISGWTGTSNNSSTASTNSLVMPASNSSVNVNYTAIPVQVVKNGGFNTYSGTSKIPKYWVKSTTFASSDGKDTSIKREGTASVRISGAAGKTKTLTQTLSLSGVAGQPFTFSYWVKGSAMPTKGSCYGQVLFYYGTSLKGTKMLKCPTGATYSWKNVKLNLTAPATYNKVFIRFTYSKASGKVWFDLASLLK